MQKTGWTACLATLAQDHMLTHVNTVYVCLGQTCALSHCINVVRYGIFRIFSPRKWERGFLRQVSFPLHTPLQLWQQFLAVFKTFPTLRFTVTWNVMSTVHFVFGGRSWYQYRSVLRSSRGLWIELKAHRYKGVSIMAEVLLGHSLRLTSVSLPR